MEKRTILQIELILKLDILLFLLFCRKLFRHIQVSTYYVYDYR